MIIRRRSPSAGGNREGVRAVPTREVGSEDADRGARLVERTVELQAQAGEQRGRLLVDALTDHAIFMLDVRGRIASWSPAAELMTGFAAADVVGRPSSCLYPSEDVEAGKHGAVLHVAGLHGKIQDDGW